MSGAGARWELGRIAMLGGDGTGFEKVLHDAGFGVVPLPPTGDGCRALAEVDPDAVLLCGADDAMRVLCSWVRARTEVPLAAVLATRRSVDPLHLFEHGVDAVWSPSIGMMELVARTRALLRRTPPRMRERVVRVGSVILDVERSTLTIDDRQLELDDRSAALAAALLRDAGRRVTTRAELVRAARITDAELDGSIRRLRSRFESVEGWRRIVSVRGVGFRLVEPPAVFSARAAAGGGHLAPAAR